MLRSTVALGALGLLAFVVLTGCGDDASLFAQTGGGPASGGNGASGGSGGTNTGAAGGNGASGGGAGASGGSGGAGGFTLEVHTSLGPDGALVLTSNLPRSIDECARIPGAPCEDLDADLLTDAWEDLVLDRLRPTAATPRNRRGRSMCWRAWVASRPGRSRHRRSPNLRAWRSAS